MGIGSKFVTVVSGFVGLAVFSQAPEFAQQYRQRLNGAVDELRIIVADFDNDALGSSMSREQALAQLKASENIFPRERGLSMEKSINRFNSLDLQRTRMDSAQPMLRPLYVLQYPDPLVLKGAWSIYQPGVPLNVPGAVYGGIGGFITLALARLGLGWNRKRRRKKADRAIGVNTDIMGPVVAAKPLEELEHSNQDELVPGLLASAVETANAPNTLIPSLLEPISLDEGARGEIDPHGNIISEKNR